MMAYYNDQSTPMRRMRLQLCNPIRTDYGEVEEDVIQGIGGANYKSKTCYTSRTGDKGFHEAGLAV